MRGAAFCLGYAELCLFALLGPAEQHRAVMPGSTGRLVKSHPKSLGRENLTSEGSCLSCVYCVDAYSSDYFLRFHINHK